MNRSAIETMAAALVNHMADETTYIPMWDERPPANRKIWVNAMEAAVRAMPNQTAAISGTASLGQTRQDLLLDLRVMRAMDAGAKA